MSKIKQIMFQNKLTPREKMNDNVTTYILKKQLAQAKYHLKLLNFNNFICVTNHIVVNQAQWLQLGILRRQKNKWTWQIKLKGSNDRKNYDYNLYPSSLNNYMFRESLGRSYNLEICFVSLSMTTSRILKSTTFLMDRIEFTLLMIK